MPSVVVIERSGSLKTHAVADINDLYKIYGSNDIVCAHTWSIKDRKLSIYGKTDGRANTENKYEFPPPIDNLLFFGKCIAVLYDETNKVVDIGKKEFATIMENLYGGFHDLGSEEEEEEEEEEENLPRNKYGYVEDGFVVNSDLEEEDLEDKKKKKIAKPKKPKLRDEITEEEYVAKS
jgi:hypothetical protein